MRLAFHLVLVLLSFIWSQNLSPAELNKLSNNPQALQMLQMYQLQGGASELSQMANPQAGSASPFDQNQTNPFISDSVSLLLGKDYALAMPSLLAALDSLTQLTDSLKNDVLPDRYSQQIFYGEKADLFSSTTSRVGKDYPLKAGDKLSLAIWGDFEKEYFLAIDNRGAVFVEGIGRVSLNGSTLEEAEEKINARLSKVYSGIQNKTTKIALRLDDLSPIKVFLLGEVANPGSYVFHGNTSILLALYIAKGPNDIGSVRNIQVTRDGKRFNMDLYEYLFSGQVPGASILKDGDIVYLPRAESLVKIEGDVGRPATYELKKNEGLKELLRYAGSLNATVAPMGATVTRLLENGSKEVLNLEEVKGYLDSRQFKLQDGDEISIPQSTESLIQSVAILGAVKYPGSYEYKDSITVKDLIDIAGGVKEGAFEERTQILRTKQNGTYELFGYSLDNKKDFYLKALDTIFVYSEREMLRKDSVFISGAIKKPKGYPYYQGMTVKDLILLSGGFTPDRESGKVRLERVISGQKDVEVLFLSIDDDYKARDGKVHLKPFDRVAIPKDPKFYRQEMVSLSGSFFRPGNYSLIKSDETLKSLVQRVGGFQTTAYLMGAQFYRRKSFVNKELLDSLTSQGLEPSVIDSVIRNNMLHKRYLIGVNLVDAIEKNNLHNIPLRDGDSLHVPTNQVAVHIDGEVGSPGFVLFKPGEDVLYYIYRSGGTTITGDIDRVILTYANGEKTTLDNIYRDPDAGSKILVPRKTPDPPTDWLKILTSTTTIVGSLVSTLILITTVN